MALEIRTRLYELAVRLERERGGDRIIGMHVCTVTEVLQDGEVVASSVNPAMPVGFKELVSMMHKDDLRALLEAAEGRK
jgi:hypothetical protein